MTTQNLQLAEPPDYAIPGIAAEMRETFRVLDALGAGWMAVLSASTTAPPTSPPQGATYRVPEGATGAWSGHARHLAIYTQVGWLFRPPRAGWISVVLDQNVPYGQVEEYDGTSWTPWVLPAAQVSTPTTDVDFVSTDLAALIIEINGRFLANETTAVDHEERLDTLENASILTAIDETADLPGSRRLVAGANITIDLSNDGEAEVSSSGGGGGGNLIAQATVTGSAATDLTVSGLDLDADQIYYIHVEAANATGTGTDIAVFFNSDTTETNYDTQLYLGVNGTNFAARTNNPRCLGLDGSTSTSGELVLSRQITGRAGIVATSMRNQDTNIVSMFAVTTWRTTGANVNSITLHAGVANGLAVGTYIKVWTR